MSIEPMEHQFLFSADGYLAEMCISEESLRTAYHLRYQAYRHAEAIPENEEKLCIDQYDSQENSRTFLIWYDNQPVASVRSLTWSSHYQWQLTPSVKYFQEDVHQHLGKQIPLLESNRYVVAPDFKGRKSFTAQMLMYRIQTLGSIVDQCAYVITAVRPKHVKFYERFMNFQSISDPLEVKEVHFPIQLLATPVISREKLAENSTIAVYAQQDLDNYRNCLQLKNAK